MIEKHVVNLETSIKLAPLLPKGFESIFCYERRNNLVTGTLQDRWAGWGEWKIIPWREQIIRSDFYKTEAVPALLLTEMLAELPYCVEFKSCQNNDCLWQKEGKRCGKRGYLEIAFDADGTRISYNCNMEHTDIIVFMAEPAGDNLETAAAKLLIELKERGLI